MLIINDFNICATCGAYSQGNGYCANGHPWKRDTKTHDWEVTDSQGYSMECHVCARLWTIDNEVDALEECKGEHSNG